VAEDRDRQERPRNAEGTFTNVDLDLVEPLAGEEVNVDEELRSVPRTTTRRASMTMLMSNRGQISLRGLVQALTEVF
jgi:hypothetical protein